MKSTLRPFLTAAKWWNYNSALMHSPAVSFCTLFSIALLTIIEVTVAGLFFGREQASHEFHQQLCFLPSDEGAKAIDEAVKNTSKENVGTWEPVISAITLVIGATTVFGQLQTSLSTIGG